ncbi:MAG TPA: hypothetical protein VFT64_00255 [Rickettsiales bacterium]|nr:hypothetical protein [Rickettsiales bacterium]
MGFWRKAAVVGSVGTVGIGAVGGFDAMNAVAASNPGWGTFWAGAGHAISGVATAIGHVVADIPGVASTILTGASHLGTQVMGGAFVTHLMGATAAATLGAFGAVAFPVAAVGIGLWAAKKVWDHFRHKNDHVEPAPSPEQQMQPERGRGREREREGPSVDQQQAMTRARGQVDNMSLPQNGYNVNSGQTVVAPQGGYPPQARQPVNVRG